MKRVLFALAGLLASVSMSFAAVDLNKATVAELDSIKGIGPAMSKRILDERTKGEFKNWNDLKARVKGVGDKKMVSFSSSGLTVNGEALANAPEALKSTGKVDAKALKQAKTDAKAEAMKPIAVSNIPVTAPINPIKNAVKTEIKPVINKTVEKVMP